MSKGEKQPVPQSQSEQAWILLSNAVGNYFGTGVNDHKHTYEARCHITMEFPQKLIMVKASAEGIKGDIFHNEVSWIGRDHLGSLSLYVVSHNNKGITPHYFHRLEEAKDSPKKIVFRFNDPTDKLVFREEVTFAIHTNYNIEHSYAWGLPGGAFKPRLAALMKKII